ncbi:MAG: phosphoglycerate kinase, partial [Candidatus Micrarchaeota archaeon]|nr:phosphoglycerate kinase [Candidatus Micrarchaeota archaeon]
EELAALDNLHKPKRPVIFVLGGAKPDDSLPILQSWLEAGKLDAALTGGVMANLMILASGRELGGSLELLKKKKVIDALPAARELVKKYGKRILIPTDVVLDDSGTAKLLAVSDLPVQQSILDIGPQTAAHYADQIEHAGTIVMNGPMGVFEKKEFAHGTKVVLDAIAHSRGFSLLGGGNTLDALDRLGIDRKKLGYVSLSGKALIEYLAGEKLPGVELVRSGGKQN